MSETISLKYFFDAKRVFEAKGTDALRFLQGMCTADLRRSLEAAKTANAYAANNFGYFLNLKGKPLSPAVFCVIAENHILFSLPEVSAFHTKTALEKYIVADDVEIIENIQLRAIQVLSISGAFKKGKELEVPHPVPGALDQVFLTEKNENILRLPRAALSADHEEWWIEDHFKIPASWESLSSEQILALRIECGIPEWGRDLNEESFLLEFPTQSAISYHKGCYLGQEVVARTTYRGHVVRAFCQFESSSQVLEDFVYSDTEAERPIGKITSALRSQGLGLLRVSVFDEASSSLFQKDSSGTKIPLKVSKVLIPYEK